MWTVKECIENYEYHLIRKVELHSDFYQSLLINKGLPPASLKEVSSLMKIAVGEVLTSHNNSGQAATRTQNVSVVRQQAKKSTAAACAD